MTTQNQRSYRQLDPGLEPWFKLFPRPVVHHQLARAAALAAPYQQRSAARIEVGLGERERLADAREGAARARRSGRLTLRVPLNRRGRAALHRSRRLALVAQISVAPPGGAPLSARRPVTLQR